MIIFLEERASVVEAFSTIFAREGISLTGFGFDEGVEWFASAGGVELSAVECVLIGSGSERVARVRALRRMSEAPMIVLSDVASLGDTLDMFSSGADDVMRKPVHVREVLARAHAIRRRSDPTPTFASVGPVRIFFDGRDPEIFGDALPLPRRERRILEVLASHRGRRVTKAQLFHAIYGILDDEVDENVVESHVSKLRKKLRGKIGYDLIDSKRYLGYCMADPVADGDQRLAPSPSIAQHRHAAAFEQQVCS